MNRSFMNLLRVLEKDDKSKWQYNCTPRKSSGYSPFFMIFGMEEMFMVDCKLGLGVGSTSGDWMKETKERMGKIERSMEQISSNKGNGLNGKGQDILEEGCEVKIKNRVLGRNEVN